MHFTDLFHNQLFICGLTAWAAAQLLKAIIYAIQNGKFEISRLFGDGGMPSGHSAIVSAVATSCAMKYGLISDQFAIAAMIALIVMHDASGVRLESGKQARAINEIFEHLRTYSLNSPRENLKEMLGHTPIQVFCGCAVGIIVAIIFN